MKCVVTTRLLVSNGAVRCCSSCQH